MILHKLKLKGVGHPFRDREVEIDFDALGPGLIALVGPNGTGKTHILEASGPGTIYREFPSYGETFAAHVPPGVRDARSELTFSLRDVAGVSTRYRAMVQADPMFGGGRGKTEAYLWNDETGTPLAGPLVKDFDQYLASILPPRDLFLASVFACQGGEGSFFGLAKSERKDLFTAMLGLAHLQELSERARARGQERVDEARHLEESLGPLRARAERAEAIETMLRESAPGIERARAEVEEARGAEARGQADLSSAREQLARAETAAAAVELELDRLARESGEASRKVDALGIRLAEINVLLEEEPQVAAAVAELAQVERDLEAATTAEREAREAAQVAVSAVTAKESELALARAAQARLLEDLKSAEDAAARAARYEELLERVEGLIYQVETAESWQAAADQLGERLVEAQRVQVARQAEMDRLDVRMTGLARRVAMGTPSTDGPTLCDACPITADSREARAELDLLGPQLEELIAAARSDFDAAAAVADARDHRRSLQTIVAKLGTALATAREGLARLDADKAEGAKAPELRVRATAGQENGLALKAEVEGLRSAWEAAGKALGGTEQERAALASRKAALDPIAGRQSTIAAARAQHDEVSSSLDGARLEAARLARAIEDLPPAQDLTPLRTSLTTLYEQIESARGAAAAKAEALRGLEAASAQLQGERAALGDAAAELATAEQRAAGAAREAADWQLLEKALGRDGVQALEVDAAGPAVTAIANDLLLACYGPRFSLAIETTALKKDGGVKEVFDVRILDSEAGQERKQGSPGEMVILGEALRLALAIFNAQRSGFELLTLWRDETVGSLDPKNADRYIAMLRRAMEIGGFSTCLFITHQESLWEQADAQIFIADGRVETSAEGRQAA